MFSERGVFSERGSGSVPGGKKWKFWMPLHKELLLLATPASWTESVGKALVLLDHRARLGGPERFERCRTCFGEKDMFLEG